MPCAEARTFDVAKDAAAKWLSRPYGSPKWEWHYLPIPRRVYAEAFLGGADGKLPVDYKVMVLNGRAHYVSVFVRQIGKPLRRITFDREWGVVPLHLPKHLGGPPDVVETALHPPRPQRLDEMLRAAEALAEDFPFVRVDFYVVDEAIDFGELTFLPSAGYAPFSPVSYDRLLGDMVDVGSGRRWCVAATAPVHEEPSRAHDTAAKPAAAGRSAGLLGAGSLARGAVGRSAGKTF